MPSFKDFLEKAKNLGVQESDETDPAGGSCRCLKNGNGPPVFLPENIADEDVVQPFQLSNWCRVLDIKPEEFGFNTGFLHNPIGPWDWEKHYAETETYISTSP